MITKDSRDEELNRLGAEMADKLSGGRAQQVTVDGDGKITPHDTKFDGDWAEADPSVIHIAQELIRKFHPWLETARIGFLFRKEAQIRNGRKILGHAQKVSPRLKPFMDYDFVIWIAKDAWDRMEEKRREALIDHELCHCKFGDSGWKIRPHEIEEFSEIIERHGFWTYDLLKVQELAAKQDTLPGMAPSGGQVGAVSVKHFGLMED